MYIVPQRWISKIILGNANLRTLKYVVELVMVQVIPSVNIYVECKHFQPTYVPSLKTGLFFINLTRSIVRYNSDGISSSFSTEEKETFNSSGRQICERNYELLYSKDYYVFFLKHFLFAISVHYTG